MPAFLSNTITVPQGTTSDEAKVPICETTSFLSTMSPNIACPYKLCLYFSQYKVDLQIHFFYIFEKDIQF